MESLYTIIILVLLLIFRKPIKWIVGMFSKRHRNNDISLKMMTIYQQLKLRKRDLAREVWDLEIAKGIVDRQLKSLYKGPVHDLGYFAPARSTAVNPQTKRWVKVQKTHDKLERQLDHLYNIAYSVHKLKLYLKKEIAYTGYIKTVSDDYYNTINDKIHNDLLAIKKLEVHAHEILNNRNYIC
jgi:hypothetical protein